MPAFCQTCLPLAASHAVTVPVDAPDPANLTTLDIPIGGYTPRVAPTPTPGIYWAAWAEYVVTTEPTQKIRHRYFAR